MHRAGKLMFLSLLAAFSLAAPANALTAERLIHGGGPIGYCTILCSFFGLAIALEQMAGVKRNKRHSTSTRNTPTRKRKPQ